MTETNNKKSYIEFKEINDWEGETWIRYIPLEKNEEAFKLLLLLNNDSECYQVNQVELSDNDINNKINKNKNYCGYMDKYGLYQGILNIEKIKLALELYKKLDNPKDNGDDLFYKMQFLHNNENWL
jgi:hypothetical protein